MFCCFAMMGNSRYRHQCGPVIQKYLPFTNITPNPERGQVHCQVVLLGLRKKTQVFKRKLPVIVHLPFVHS